MKRPDAPQVPRLGAERTLLLLMMNSPEFTERAVREAVAVSTVLVAVRV